MDSFDFSIYHFPGDRDIICVHVFIAVECKFIIKDKFHLTNSKCPNRNVASLAFRPLFLTHLYSRDTRQLDQHIRCILTITSTNKTTNPVSNRCKPFEISCHISRNIVSYVQIILLALFVEPTNSLHIFSI